MCETVKPTALKISSRDRLSSGESQDHAEFLNKEG